MSRPAWVDKVFEFSLAPNQLPEVIARLNSTSGRLRKLLASATEADMEIRLDSKWSIKENIGHLSDLEPLHIGRLSDLENRLSVLRPADMSNKLTEATDHNSNSLRELLSLLDGSRAAFVEKLQSLDKRAHQHAALHERLDEKMRPIDVAAFVAAHDDHHLETITELLAIFKRQL